MIFLMIVVGFSEVKFRKRGLKFTLQGEFMVTVPTVQKLEFLFII